MKAILLAPVELFWNGGIGTYVKATTESHGEVGDKANDAIRVNGGHLRVTVVGEGGNLGCTQRGRIEFAQTGGHVYTDFIDNSAGVDCSDHEVNIKILLSAQPELSLEDRNALLAEMTDEVGELVLRDNYLQATALGTARSQAHSLLPVHRRLITALEQSGRLDRALEGLPADEELATRFTAGQGLATPEFAVLMAYVKIAMEEDILHSDLPDETWTHQLLSDYFPTPLRDRCTDAMAQHPLKREIVTTAIVNEVVNRGGISFVFRAMEETGAHAADVLRAYVIVRDVFDLPRLWAAVEEQDNRIPTDAQTIIYLQARRLLDRAVRWLVQSRRQLDVPAEIERLQPGVAALLPQLTHLFLGVERDALAKHSQKLEELAVPVQLAEWGTQILHSFGLLDVVEVANQTGRSLDDVAGVYFVLSERFRVDDLLTKISMLPREDRWQTLARMALRYDLYAALAALTAEVLAASPDDADLTPEERVNQWEQVNEASITRAFNAIGEFDSSRADLAALSVLLRQIRTLVMR